MKEDRTAPTPPPKTRTRERWEARNPVISFRLSVELRERMREWKEQVEISYPEIMKLGLERLEHLELLKALKAITLQKGGENAHDFTKS